MASDDDRLMTSLIRRDPNDLDDDALFTDLLTHVGALGGEPWKVFVVILVGMNAGGFQQRLLEALQAAHPTAAIIGGVATGTHLVRAHGGAITALEDGLGCLMFGGNVPLVALVSRGAEAISGTYRMAECTTTTSPTSSDGNQLSSESGVVACVSVTAAAPAGAVSGVIDETMPGRAVPVMDAIMSAIEAAGTAARRGVLLGISADPSTEGYTLHQLDRSLFDQSTRSLLLHPSDNGGRTSIEQWRSGAMRLYAL
jgi:hypothetical protein